MHRVAVAILVIAVTGCGVAGPICAKRAQCAADPPGPDFQRICEINYDGQIRSLRANREEVCGAQADAQLALDLCKVELDCGDFNEADLGGNCAPEREDLQEAIVEAEDECLVID